MTKCKIPIFSYTLGKNETLNMQNKKKSARSNCWQGHGVLFGAYFVSLASKPWEEICFEIRPLRGRRALT
jgi:hypothetical protein